MNAGAGALLAALWELYLLRQSGAFGAGRKKG